MSARDDRPAAAHRPAVRRALRFTVLKSGWVSKSQRILPSAAEYARRWPSIEPENTTPCSAVTAASCPALHPGLPSHAGLRRHRLPQQVFRCEYQSPQDLRAAGESLPATSASKYPNSRRTHSCRPSPSPTRCLRVRCLCRRAPATALSRRHPDRVRTSRRSSARRAARDVRRPDPPGSATIRNPRPGRSAAGN